MAERERTEEAEKPSGKPDPSGSEPARPVDPKTQEDAARERAKSGGYD